jgi:16S rRNA pseudouridine516 synthase
MELERILHSQGFGSRRQCQALIANGAVAVRGAPCLDPHHTFATEDFEFTVDGVSWTFQAKAYLALHKPSGFECSHTPQHHSSIFSLLPAPLRERGVQCVGRLDQDTTGLILLSDDGAFVHAYTSPKRKVPKVYHVSVKHPLDEAQLAALCAGVMLHGEPMPLRALTARQRTVHELELTILEGKYHQVKRMVAAVGNRVEALHRHAIGGFALPATLAAGQWIWLSAAQRARLQALD